SSARSMSPKARIKAAIDRPDSSRKIRPTAASSNREMAFMSSSLSGLGYVSEWADLDRLRDCGAGLRRPGEGGVEVVGLDDVEAAQMFLRFGEGAVGGQHVAVGHAHDRCGLGFVQGAAKEPGALRLHLLLQNADPPHELLHLLLGLRVTGLALDAVDGQQVLRHGGPPLDGRALPASHPHYERASARLTGRVILGGSDSTRVTASCTHRFSCAPFRPSIK